MKILGLMMVKNGADLLLKSLDSMSRYCDAIYVINDRSTDATLELLTRHPSVRNIFTVDSSTSQQDWYFPEAMLLNFLYRMADFYSPDWVVLLDHDMTLEPAEEMRGILENVGGKVSLIHVSCISVWNDTTYPLLVPLMGQATSIQGRIWRYHPNLFPGSKPLHNVSYPANILEYGVHKKLDSIAIYHYGWDTLEKRMAKVVQYMRLDPGCEYNFGVPYDRGLLFGYSVDQVADLIREYRRRAGADGATG